MRAGLLAAIVLGFSAESASAGDARRQKKESAPIASEEDAAPAAPSVFPWLDFDLGAGVIDRRISYHQDISSHPLLPYSLPAGPILVVDIVAYPHGPAAADSMSNLGFEVELQQGIVSSDLQVSGSEVRFGNTVHDFAGGVRYRFPFSTSDEVFISATYGEDAFTFSGPNRGDLAIPDTIYRYMRPGIGARFGLGGGLSMRAALGYRALTNAGGAQIGALFPRLVAAGADAELVGGYAVNDRIAIRLGVEWRRYWYSMNSRPGDAFIAGGAIDQSLVFTGALALTIDPPSAGPPETGPTPDEGSARDGDAGGE